MRCKGIIPLAIAACDVCRCQPGRQHPWLGGSAVTNTGPTTIDGDLGVFPGTSITGEASITLSRERRLMGSRCRKAHSDTTTACNGLAGMASECQPDWTGPGRSSDAHVGRLYV